MTKAGSHRVMNSNALELITWLEERYQEQDDYGWPTWYIAQQMNWSKTKVRTVIDWSRNRVADPRYMIHAFRGETGRWYYKKPTPNEALLYENVRGRDVAVRAGHVLLMVRKRATEYGITQQTDKRTNAYVEVLSWMREAGVKDADAILEEALRDLSSTNGHRPAA
jgi:hypothetical protein